MKNNRERNYFKWFILKREFACNEGSISLMWLDLWHIYHCGLFTAKKCSYVNIIYILFVSEYFVRSFAFKRARAHLLALTEMG